MFCPSRTLLPAVASPNPDSPPRTPHPLPALQLQALLHGHSYSAYPLGCTATALALSILQDPAANPNLCTPHAHTAPGPEGGLSGEGEVRCSRSPPCSQPCGRLLPMWDATEVSALSCHPLLTRVTCVGTVLAVEMRSAADRSEAGKGEVEEGSAGSGPGVGGPDVGAGSQCGYVGGGRGSSADVVQRLWEAHDVYARPLGNVVYCVLTPTSSKAVAARLLLQLRGVLDEMLASGGGGAARGEHAWKGQRDGCVV